jgi:Zn-dependent protease/CBS domain-containing protein
MRWSFRIATILGTQVRVHATFALLLVYVAWTALSDGEGSGGALEAMLLVCAMFTCVLMHEFGHVLAARRYGIKTPDITLLPIGGVARLERMPRKPSEELVVALCGPLVNVLIAGTLAFVIGVEHLNTAEEKFMRAGNFFETLMVWNVMMVLFNLIPAFPMDGGRVLRALLAWITGDYAKATKWAATIGQGLAVVAATLVVAHKFPPTMLLIAFFVFFAAGQEAAMVTEQEQVQGLRVRDAMLTEFHTLPANAVLRDAVDLLLGCAQHDFPVLDDHGKVIGMLMRRRLVEALAIHGPGYPAQLVLDPCGADVAPDTSLTEALQQITAGVCPALPVREPVHDKLVGLLTTENIGETLMVRSALRHRMAVIES